MLPKWIRLNEERIPVLRGWLHCPFAAGMICRGDDGGRRIGIRVDSPPRPDYEQETLLHELIHIADMEARQEMERFNTDDPDGIFIVAPDPLREQYVEAFGKVLYRMLRDTDLWNANPEPSIDQLSMDFEV